jgi:hypothetical protein
MKLLLLTLATLFSTSIVIAQTNYGGSACAKVKNSEGRYRYICAVTSAYASYSNQTDAKKALENSLNNKKGYNEEIVDYINCDIDEADGSNHNGQASVKVKNKNGDIRVITVSTGDYESDKTKIARKRELLRKLESELRSDEIFIDEINFDI